jgi:hypothetical protein
MPQSDGRQVWSFFPTLPRDQMATPTLLRLIQCTAGALD